jgi:hypothetical protein
MMKSALVILAAIAVVAAVNAQDADSVVPEMDNSVLIQEDDTVDQAIEAYKAAVDVSINALNTRTQLAVQAKAMATGRREEAQWETAELMAHNDAIMSDMGEEFPMLMEIPYEPATLVGTGMGSAKMALKKAEKKLEEQAGYGKEEKKEEPKKDDEDDKQKAASAFAGDVSEDYGKCVTPPELSGLFTGGSAPLFGKVKQPAPPKKEDLGDSVGAIRTMCHDEIVEKGSYKEKDAKTLSKMKATEKKAKESSEKAEARASELQTKAADSEKAQKASVKEAASKSQNTKEAVTKTGAEATEKTKATAAIGAKEVTAKDKFNKIKSIATTHKTVQHTAHKAEKRVTIVQGGADNAVEIKGKHQWQHQELVDKAGVEHSHKETAGKIDKLVKTVSSSKGGKTIIERGSGSGAEKAAKTQLAAFKRFTQMENKQKTSETKTKVRTNEVLIKGGEKLGKHKEGKTVVVNKGTVNHHHYAEGHPDKEIAGKLIKTNKELTMKLQKVNENYKATPNNAAVITVLKAQVKELQEKKTPKATAIIKPHYTPPPPPAPAPKASPAPASKGGKEKVKVVKEKVYITPAPTPKVACHKETSAKHPFAGLEKNVKQIMKLKGGVEKAQKGCQAKAESKVKVVQKEATTKLEKSQKMVVAAKLTLKDRESEICDKSRKASELSNKHQTHFWVGMVKEVRSKVVTKPPEVDHSDWKNKLCAAVHNDVQRMAGIKAVDLLQ